VNPPSTVVTVILASPGETALIIPVISTAATESLLEVHVTCFPVASEGATVALSCDVWPTVRDRAVLSRVTPVTGTTAVLTSTSQYSVNPPSTVVTVIVAAPGETALIFPVISTAATESLLEVHVTCFPVASEGEKEGIRVYFSPTPRISEVLSREMPLTGIVGALTDT